MTIRRGEEWGTRVPPPAGLMVATSDAELAQLVIDDARGAYGLSGGDLHRSLGAPPARSSPGEDLRRLPLDALRVRTDDREMLAVAHVVARNGWWRGQLLAILNCADVGNWNVAPRAHPNDGRFDVVTVDAAMSLRQRWQARRRLPLGTHVPHPAIDTKTAETGAWDFARPREVYVDGVRCGRATRLEVTIAPDHFSIHI